MVMVLFFASCCCSVDDVGSDLRILLDGLLLFGCRNLKVKERKFEDISGKRGHVNSHANEAVCLLHLRSCPATLCHMPMVSDLESRGGVRLHESICAIHQRESVI